MTTITVKWSTDYVERIAREVRAKCDAAVVAEADGLAVDIDDLGALASFVLDALSALAALQEDTARLDWVQAERASLGHHKDTNRWWSRAGARFPTVREAIDVARGRQP